MACCWRPRPLSAASQYPSRVRQVYLECHGTIHQCSGPYSCLAPTIWGGISWHLRQGMPGSRFPVGLYTLQVIHHIIPQPNTPSWRLVSSAWCLSGPCCSPRRVVCDAEAQGLIGYLYTRRCFHILPHRFHGAQRGTSGGYSQSAANPCSAGLPPGGTLVLFMFLPQVVPHAAFGAPGVRAGAAGPWHVPLLASRQ